MEDTGRRRNEEKEEGQSTMRRAEKEEEIPLCGDDDDKEEEEWLSLSVCSYLSMTNPPRRRCSCRCGVVCASC